MRMNSLSLGSDYKFLELNNPTFGCSTPKFGGMSLFPEE